MTIESETSSMGGSERGAASQGGGGAKAAASTAVDEAKSVTQGAVGASKDVAHEAAAQATEVVQRTKEQLGTVVSQAKDEVRTQLDQRGAQLTTGLQTLSRQLAALGEGRPQEAGHLGEFLDDARRRVQNYAGSLDARGPEALVDDVAAFARRRPMIFLAAASAIGFAAGRLARAGAMSGMSGGSSGSSGFVGQSSVDWAGVDALPTAGDAMLPPTSSLGVTDPYAISGELP